MGVIDSRSVCVPGCAGLRGDGIWLVSDKERKRRILLSGHVPDAPSQARR